MKKLQSFACYAMVTPVLLFGSGTLLADQHTGSESDDMSESIQLDESEANTDMDVTQESQNSGYLESAPANGMHASKLIGADVMSNDDETVGSISELIIDESGQVVAVVVGVGGFLGMGEKDVAINWDDITKSGTGDDQELRVTLTREDLSSAPMFEDLN